MEAPSEGLGMPGSAAGGSVAVRPPGTMDDGSPRPLPHTARDQYAEAAERQLRTGSGTSERRVATDRDGRAGQEAGGDDTARVDDQTDEPDLKYLTTRGPRRQSNDRLPNNRRSSARYRQRSRRRRPTGWSCRRAHIFFAHYPASQVRCRAQVASGAWGSFNNGHGTSS